MVLISDYTKMEDCDEISYITPIKEVNSDKAMADQNSTEQKSSSVEDKLKGFRMEKAKHLAANLDEAAKSIKNLSAAKGALYSSLLGVKKGVFKKDISDASKPECASDKIRLTEVGTEFPKETDSKEDEKKNVPMKCNKEENAAGEDIPEKSIIDQDSKETMEKCEDEEERVSGEKQEYREGEENIEDDEDREDKSSDGEYREDEDKCDHYEEDKEENGSNSLDNNYHSDCLDIDNMTYEQLLALEDKIGKVNKGLSDAQIEVIFSNT
eukprot:TRINITY_DN6418_c0_g3_i1.p1 TRINITY_DN6418_c0_g3~~TRINITY_DN6418_c0_g3_i1.p1  ORF type:complete len:268 (+),score=58.60 TRINITY_DN6418_c0_g3_i1:535-1338(+)